MGIPNATHQWGSNAIASLGNFISLHTAAAGTTGANEASGGSYVRVQLASAWVPDGLGDNNGPQVNVNCPAGTYVEGGIWSVLSGGALAVPSGFGATGSTTGGTFAAATYYWKVTATNWQGETTPSLEVSAALTGTTSSCALAWSAVSGATGYRIYRGTASGSENVLVATVTGITYTDTGTAGTSATLPGSNTAVTFVGSNAFVGGSVTVSGTGASINVSPSITV